MSKVQYVVEFYHTPSPLRATRLRQWSCNFSK